MEPFADEADPGGVEDLPSASFQVFRADSRHASKLKRMFVLDKWVGRWDGWLIVKKNEPSIFWENVMNVIQRAVALGLGAALLQALMLLAFAWPATEIAPRDLPLAVAGPQAAMVEARLTGLDPDAFELTTVPDEAAAREAITGREVYGAIVTGGGAPRVLVASGAGPAVAQQLTQLGRQLSGAPAAQIEDVVPADPDDPRGAGFGAMALPLVMAGIAGGVVLTLLIPSAGGRALGAVVFGIAGGLLSMVIAQTWLSVVPGDYLQLSLVAGLVSFAVAGTVAGLATVVGRAGIGIAALLMLLVGNPFSAATSAPELLPQPWGLVGQLLPPGAAASLLRSVAFFDWAGAQGPLLVLLAWSALALVLLGVGAIRDRGRTEPVPGAPAPAPVPA